MGRKSAGKKEGKEEIERNSEFSDFRDERIDFFLASIFTHPLSHHPVSKFRRIVGQVCRGSF